MSRNVLFVCTGNTCRSPLAAAMARQLAAARGLDLTVSSAGTDASPGAPASDGSMLVALERDLDLSTHRARLLTRDLVAAAAVILGMAPQHVQQALALGGEGKAFLLADFAAREATDHAVHDPFGAGLDAYRHMADQLAALMPAVLERLAGDSLAPELP